MRILMLTPYLPYPLLSGGQIRTYNLLKQLSRKHDITLFALIKDAQEGESIKALKPFCKTVRVFKRSSKPFTLHNILKTGFSSYPFLVIRNFVPQLVTALREELANHAYDVIHAETFYMMPHIPPTQVPVLLVEQTIEYLGYESYAQKRPALLRPLLQIDIAKIKHWEKFYWQTCTRLATMSEDDRRFIAHEIGQSTNIDVVSNGVDVEWFAQKARREPATPTLLSVGTFHWLPNVEAVRHLVQHIWPLVKQQQPQAKLWIVGNGPTPEVRKYESLDPHIEVTGGIPDIRDAFTQAHVLVASVLSGKGTRYKVLEAMASGTPIVATPTAVEGLGVVHGEQVLLGNTAEELAAHVLRVISDPQLRQHLAVAGLQFVRERYDWQGIAQSLDRVYERMAAHPQVSMQVT
jgi:glycosyltransferase involved in cell wall biosynthesis